MSGIEGEVITIIGASIGIGEAIALLLTERGPSVVLRARDRIGLRLSLTALRQRAAKQLFSWTHHNPAGQPGLMQPVSHS